VLLLEKIMLQLGKGKNMLRKNLLLLRERKSLLLLLFRKNRSGQN
jgi:hypothetical protein